MDAEYAAPLDSGTAERDALNLHFPSVPPLALEGPPVSCPDLYLAVVAVTGTEDSSRLGGSGTPIEYCVKMRRVPRAAQVDRVLARGEVTAGVIEALARLIAQFHARAECASAGAPYGSAAEVGQYTLENFTHIGTGPAEVYSRAELALLDLYRVYRSLVRAKVASGPR